ncbi:hypothetical protein HZA55_07510 [Candidatus Poribacteria bacterium]|nr:hypothetical protein [Candidatus Poribacteria bacterium]
MPIALQGINITILAKNNNPSIVSKEWLKQKNILEEEATKFTHTPLFSYIETTNFILIVDPDRLQLQLKDTSIPSNFETLAQIIKEYLSKLPETPYTAIGFNYEYHLIEIKNNLKEIFKVNDDKFKKILSSDYDLGGIIKSKYNDFTLSININPIKKEEIIVNFNYHYENNNTNMLKEKLDTFLNTKQNAESILGELFNA